MNETSPDTGHDDGEQIDVDLNADDPAKAVTRTKPVKSARAGKDEDGLSLDVWADRSRKVNRRINTMQRNFDQQRAEDAALHQREIAELRSKLDGLTRGKDGVSGDEAAHEKAMEQLSTALEEAQERGDSKEVAKLTRQISTLDAKFWAAQTAKATGSTAAADRDEAKPRPAAGQAPNPTKAGIEWAKANTDWWDNKQDDDCVAARGLANTLYAKMIAEGEDAQQPAFYERIRKQVAKRFPELEVVSTVKGRDQDDPDDPDDEDEGEQVDRRGRAPVKAPSLSLPDRGQGTARTRREQQSLTAADQRVMRSVNLDPSNNKHVIEFLRSKNDIEANA